MKNKSSSHSSSTSRHSSSTSTHSTSTSKSSSDKSKSSTYHSNSSNDGDGTVILYILGIISLIASFPVLWYNEKKSVEVEKLVDKVKKQVKKTLILKMI